MNIELLKSLGRCRVIDASMAKKFLGISEQELEEGVQNKILFRERIQDKKEELYYYSLTEKGEKFLKEQVPSFGEIYRGFILEHDLELMSFYLKCSEEEKESWLTRDDLIKKYKFPGTIDGAFTNLEGVVEGIEVLSKKALYTFVEKAEEFVKHANIQRMNYILY